MTLELLYWQGDELQHELQGFLSPVAEVFSLKHAAATVNKEFIHYLHFEQDTARLPGRETWSYKQGRSYKQLERYLQAISYMIGRNLQEDLAQASQSQDDLLLKQYCRLHATMSPSVSFASRLLIAFWFLSADLQLILESLCVEASEAELTVKSFHTL